MAHATIQSDDRITFLESQIALLQHEQERSRRVFQAISNISSTASGIRTIPALFETVQQEIKAIFVWDRCVVAAIDPDAPDRFGVALLADQHSTQLVEQVEPELLPRQVLAQRAPLLLHDLVAEQAGAWLGVPLLTDTQTIGIIYLHSERPSSYTEHDRDLLQHLADGVAIAMTTIGLFHHQQALNDMLTQRFAERSQEVELLSILARELVQQRPLPLLLDRVLELTIPLLQVQGGTVRLLDPPGVVPVNPRGRELVLATQRGLPPEFVEQAVNVPVEGTPLGRVVIENQPHIVTSGLHQHPFRGVAPPFESLLAVPMRIGERILGALSLVSTQHKTFHQEQIELAQAIGNQIAIAIESSRMFSERERQIAELWAINSISRAAGIALDLPMLLRQVYDTLGSFMQLDAFSMVIYDPTRQIISDGISIDEGQEYTYLSNQPPPPDSVTSWVIRNRITLHFRDVAAEIADYPELKAYIVGADKLAAAWLGVPLFDRDQQVIGVIALQGYSPSAFTERDELFLVNVARQVALHVQNVRLLTQRERQIRELDAIGNIGKLISASFDYETILQGVYQTLQGITGAPVFYLAICDPVHLAITNSVFIEQGEHTDLAWQGQIPAPGSLTEWILRQRQPLLFTNLDTQQDDLAQLGITPQPFGNNWVVRSWVGVPLLAKDGEPIGLIALQDYEPHLYDEQTVTFLSQVASHISLGIQKLRLFEEREQQVQENARLFEEAQRQAHEIELVYRIASVLSSRLDQQEILDLASQELVQLFWADHTGTVLFDEDMQWGTVMAEYPPRAALGIRVPLFHNALIDELVTSHRPVQITSTDTDPHAEASRDTFTQLGIASLVVVPLVSRGRVVGSISLDSFTPREFTAEEQELFLTVAASIAAAVENARLFAAEQQHAADAERQAQRMELVNRISLVLSKHLDLQEILDLAAREVVHLFWADHAGIVLFDAKEEWGTVVSEYPDSGAAGLRFAITDNDISAQVIATRRPVWVYSVANDPRTNQVRDTLHKLGVVSITAVPLISRGRVIGSIGLDSFTTPRDFSEEEQELFLTVAASIATAVENARLFAAEQEARRTADTLREVARVLSSSINPEEVLHLILHELRNIVAYDTASIMLVDGRMLRMAACQGWPAGEEPQGLTFTISNSGAGQVVIQGQPIVRDDITNDPFWTNKNIGEHIRSWLGVPLVVKGAIQGVLNIDSREAAHFTEREVEVARAFANQAAVALENARLYQESVTRVEQELTIARRIQSNLFPRSLPKPTGITLDARCVPARETGGDFYDVISLSNRRLGIIVGDVSGKSIPAAMLMAVARSITRSEATDHETPQAVMCETNRWIVQDVPRQTFVALCYATLDLDQRRLAFANAGQLAPIRRQPNGQIEHLEAPEPRLPLGIMTNIAYQALEIAVDPGDLLVFYTDGIVEAHNNEHELFGFERFEALVRTHGDLPPTAFINKVMQTIHAFTDGNPQHDDITLVVVRVE